MSQKQNNISYLIASLRQFQESGDKKLSENRDLFDKTQEVFEKLHLLSDFDEKDLNKIISRLEILPPEIKEQLIEELGKEITESESKALNKQDLKQLLEEYEKARRRSYITDLRLLVDVRFQDLFHSPNRGAFHLSLTVLVHYRSQSSI